jgi:hypothetical protein
MHEFDIKDRTIEKGEIGVCVSIVWVIVEEKNGVSAVNIEKRYKLQIQRKKGWAQELLLKISKSSCENFVGY